MYLAQIHGKLPSNFEGKEDLLTSNVFSLFKYGDRIVFLKKLLDLLEITATEDELNKADFLFWPVFDDKTEPDLIITVGKYYLLIEAKLFSGFRKEQLDKKHQVIREIEEGLKQVENRDNFRFIAVTDSSIYNKIDLQDIDIKYKKYVNWITWQNISKILMLFLGNDDGTHPNYLFAKDLYQVLDRQKLRGYQGFQWFSNFRIVKSTNIFYETEKGKFLGFRSLKTKQINVPEARIFFLS